MADTIELTVADHATCYRSSKHPLGMLAAIWLPLGTWVQLCDNCAADYATRNHHPMRGYEACEQHHAYAANCRGEHLEAQHG